MQIADLYHLIQTERLGEVHRDEPLSEHTTWRIGGPADLFYWPDDQYSCARVVLEAHHRRIPVVFLGAGSNVLVADEGVRGLVIQTKKFNQIVWEGKNLAAGAGTALAHLSQLSVQKGLTGLEFACGIPGSVGGAALMNAGAYGSSMSKVVSQVRTLTLTGEIRQYQNEQLEFGYRTSLLKHRTELILEVLFTLEQGDSQESKKLMEEYLQRRKQRHPLHLPNAGSVFRNPPDIPAGRLIEQAGAKGLRVGDAQVSEQHGNFIVNLNRATAKDVLRLIREVQEVVYQKKAIWLETEVVLLGFEDNRR